MLKEFKEFALKGNLIETAVGIVVGLSFGKIISSLVADIIMPPIGLFLGGIDFSHFVITLKAATETSAAVTLNYGLFINTIIDFFIIALVIFVVIKMINKLKKKADDQPAEPTEEVKLLTEIRDALKNK